MEWHPSDRDVRIVDPIHVNIVQNTFHEPIPL